LTSSTSNRSIGVFINCPFDKQFQPLHDAIIFAVSYCQLQVRSGLLLADSGETRLMRILRLLEQSRFSIHDLSRVELSEHNRLPRFNMPLELGLALGMKHLGRSHLRDHVVVVLDSDPHRYKQSTSDLAGVDIGWHENDPAKAVTVVRDALGGHVPSPLPSGAVINEARKAFEQVLPAMAAAAQQRIDQLTFVDRLRHLSNFIAGTQNQ
jgi:hypothetical protein